MAQREMPESQLQAAARSEFDRILVAAHILLTRRTEIVIGMVAEGNTKELSEQRFSAQLTELLEKARHYAAVAGMSESEQQDQFERLEARHG